MGLPIPQYSLTGSCSALFNNTLFTYSAVAFQSLTMTNDAAWTTLDMGVPVSGGVCVKSTPVNDTTAAALYIVGGTTKDTSYQGLQRYTFANQSWETISPTVPVTQGRLYHDAVYLNRSDSILVYSGTQDGSKQLSSQTFTIQASPPFSVLAYESIAPPAISPILLQWSESKAMYMGGSETNQKAMIFSPSESWVDSNATFAAPIYNISSVKAVVINGNDGSKNIYTLDMTTSPNSINRTVLIDANGNPVQNAAPVEERSPKEKRNELTVANWPPYNGTLAPMTTRTTFSVAKDQSGMVVISGGNEKDVLCIFTARKNTWVNATAKLGSKSVVSQQGLGKGPSPTILSLTPSASATSVPDSTPVVIPAESPRDDDPERILGAVLGSIGGLAIFLIAILAFVRWRRRRKQAAENERRVNELQGEKDGMDFVDRGLPEMTPAKRFPGHEPSASQGSTSSMAIIMGRVGVKTQDSDDRPANGWQDRKDPRDFVDQGVPEITPMRRFQGHEPSASQSSCSSIAIMMGRVGNGRGDEKGIESEANNDFNDYFKAPDTAYLAGIRDEKTVSFAETGPATPGAGAGAGGSRPRGSTKNGRRGSTRRSSGWNRYWSGGGSSLNILGLGSKRTTYEGSDRSSQYSIDQDQTRPSAIVPPLKITGDRPEISSVMSYSPTVQSHHPMPGEMAGRIGRSGSIRSSTSSEHDRHDAFSSGVPESVDEQHWTPADGAAGWHNRASEYSESNYATTVGRRTEVYSYDNEAATQFPGSQHLHPLPRNDMSWLNLGDTRI
ncbi:uncharacterized protein L3040_009192 [Drepanopeziza brunnea f. sp. 'multigermtubi']|uniref:Pre-mRNA splicing factor CLF1 n=1 Tax=Marssonina brunnea f. sp. multigermtubi (strain MB_m1) TaxID=1072389 RepID=K1WDI1_MARBU|nr:pre-mRNA splicing factor CLF1 [Drepanopeziza brunnea f. sp. 'multigermtubi' MB_m1]EKD15480.1 pre-mRNA splicing factor CLF1 [Drepanopeziza brunnea f. sp. 'multigermtubi' MB_m1]KAJ5032594.1 hypothetical protein L3040_009192 [Drepanopeziza brunnea f. sp. 'multigermtubi']